MSNNKSQSQKEPVLVNIFEMPEIMDKLTYTDPKLLDKGAKRILLNYKNEPLQIITPLMATWGIADFVDISKLNDLGDGKFKMPLNFPSESEENEETKQFLKNIQNLDNKIQRDIL